VAGNFPRKRALLMPSWVLEELHDIQGESRRDGFPEVFKASGEPAAACASFVWSRACCIFRNQIGEPHQPHSQFSAPGEGWGWTLGT